MSFLSILQEIAAALALTRVRSPFARRSGSDGEWLLATAVIRARWFASNLRAILGITGELTAHKGRMIVAHRSKPIDSPTNQS